MGIEKMELVNIVGKLEDLDNVLLKCCESKCFHIEPAINESSRVKGLKLLNEDNPYTDLLSKYKMLASNLSIKLCNTEGHEDKATTLEEYDNYISQISEEATKLNQKKQENLTLISEYNEAIKQTQHLLGLNSKFERIFACKYVKVRVGKLPADNFSKLSYYNDKDFIFVPFDENSTYVWGMYFAPEHSIALVDYIFTSFYFERIRVPDFVKGTPEKALSDLRANVEEKIKENLDIDKQIEKLVEENKEKIVKIYNKLSFLSSTFEIRKKVAVINNKFYIVGFIPRTSKNTFSSLFKEISSVSVTIDSPDMDSSHMPPTKLKNGFFSKPFSMLVEMYGLPDYNGINPTAFFAILYSLLFGIMFGDLGQGAVLVAIGLIMTRVKKIPAGGILTRVGASSMIFGLVYGSVFGFEHLLDPLYKLIGLNGKPVEVFEQTNFIMISAIVIGVLIIAVSIIFNIIIGFKQRNYEKAIFGNNGITGLVFYLSLLIGIAVQVVSDVKIMTAPYVILLIVLPLVIMFLRVPLSNYVKYRKAFTGEDKPVSIGNFIAENFFELFEFLLSFATNTVSFLRVGGFVLSHAGMMLVVMTLSEMVSKGVSIFIVIFGNIFVMGLEGLIVAIQVMRLGYYEVFSRFYEANGKPFVPVGTNVEE